MWTRLSSLSTTPSDRNCANSRADCTPHTPRSGGSVEGHRIPPALLHGINNNTCVGVCIYYKHSEVLWFLTHTLTRCSGCGALCRVFLKSARGYPSPTRIARAENGPPPGPSPRDRSRREVDEGESAVRRARPLPSDASRRRAWRDGSLERAGASWVARGRLARGGGERSWREERAGAGVRQRHERPRAGVAPRAGESAGGSQRAVAGAGATMGGEFGARAAE